MQEERTLAITLRSVAFQEKKQILTLFSEKEGLCSLILKNISLKNSPLLSLSSPFCLGEFLYRKGRGEIFSFIDGTPLEEHLFLRQNLSYFESACEMAKALLHSQLPHKSSLGIFLLFQSFLKNIPLFNPSHTLLASFYLKLLFHEGLLHVKSPGNPSNPSTPHLEKNEGLCLIHAPSYISSFSLEEQHLLSTLLTCRSFSHLQTITIPFELKERIACLFFETVKGN